MPALLPVKKNLSSPLCLKLRITPQSVTYEVTGDKPANDYPVRDVPTLNGPQTKTLYSRCSMVLIFSPT